MGTLFKDELQDFFGTWPLGYIPYGAADYGELEAVARAVGDGDDGAYYQAWNDAADRLVERGKVALARGKRESARHAFLHASCHYSASYHILFGKPVDPRLTAAFRKQLAAFNDGLALLDPPVTQQRIPFGEHTFPAYFLPASGYAGRVRPLLILTNGYDATVTQMYFGSAVAASLRGYHVLFFDGPGQGEMLYEHDMHLRADWENVITPIVDYALQFQEVDAKKIALSGWSLGGYLSPRGASGEHRLAACIADPGLFGVADAMRQNFIRMGASPQSVENLADVDQKYLDMIETQAKTDRHLYWTFMQRGFWTHGVDDLRGYVRAVADFTLEGRVENISCPTLLTSAENDPLAQSAPEFLERLRCPKKTLIKFTAQEGAGTHVEGLNRTILNDRVCDWLDEVLA